MAIGDVIASFRRKKRIDQKQMAKNLGISANYLSQVENNGKSPSVKLLKQIAENIGIPLTVLLFEVIKDSDILDEEERQLFLKAKPLMDKMVSLLLPDETQET